MPELAELASRLTSDGSVAMTESLEISEGPGDLQLRLPSFVRSGSKRYEKVKKMSIYAFFKSNSQI